MFVRGAVGLLFRRRGTSTSVCPVLSVRVSNVRRPSRRRGNVRRGRVPATVSARLRLYWSHIGRLVFDRRVCRQRHVCVRSKTQLSIHRMCRRLQRTLRMRWLVFRNQRGEWPTIRRWSMLMLVHRTGHRTSVRSARVLSTRHAAVVCVHAGGGGLNFTSLSTSLTRKFQLLLKNVHNGCTTFHGSNQNLQDGRPKRQRKHAHDYVDDDRNGAHNQ